MTVVKVKAKKNYINNKTLFEEMVKYKDSVKEAAENGKEKPIVSNYIGQSFMQICNRLAYRPNFMNYTYRDDMVADGIENCIASIDNFNPERSNNPFAYFTQIAWNAFIRRIQKEKKQTYVKHKNFENSYMMDELMADGDFTASYKSNEYADDLVRAFENKLELTKIKKKNTVGLEKYIEENSHEK